MKEIEADAGAALRTAVGLREAGQDALAVTQQDVAEFIHIQVDQPIEPYRATLNSSF